MKTLQLSNTLLRATAAPPSFLLPAFSQPLKPNGLFCRRLSSKAPLNAATGTAEARTDSTTPTTRRPVSMPQAYPRRAPTYTDDTISAALGDMLKPTRPKSRDHPRDLRALQEGLGGASVRVRQESVAEGMGIERTHEASSGAVDKPPPPVRLHAYLGRTIEVNERSGLQGALKSLDIGIAKNKVKMEARAQRYHERAGIKRKRLRSLRWRARFMDGFKATVQKVQNMRRMGW